MSEMSEESSALQNGVSGVQLEDEVNNATIDQPEEHGEEAEEPEEVVEDNVNGANDNVIGGEIEIQAETRVLAYLQEAREEDGVENGYKNGSTFRKFKVANDEGATRLEEIERMTSSVGSYSTPDDTPSIQGSAASSIGGSALGSRYSPSPLLQPFDRRFQSRLHPAIAGPSANSRALSPSLIGVPRSRTSSLGSKIGNVGNGDGLDNLSAPWDVVRWTKLKKITSQFFSEGGKRSFGTPTCIMVSAAILIGTTKGIILAFDYSQTLKSIIGPGTQAVECGAITALAVSADHTTIAGGHANGFIFTWELVKPSRPFLRIVPLAPHQMENRKENGHIEGVSILHLGFLGIRRTALVSADDKGMAFSHLATRGLGAVARVVKTARLLGRYPADIPPTGRTRKPSSVLGMSVLPLGNSQESTDSMGLVAMLTPYLLVIISTTPIAQTQHKAVRHKEVASDSALSGCLSWYPAVKLKQNTPSQPASSKAKLAYAWSNVLTVLELSVVEPGGPEDPNRPPTLEFRGQSRYSCDEAIVSIQWFSRQIIGVLTITQRLIILENNGLRITETFDLMPKRILHRDLFSRQLHSLLGRMDEEGSVHQQVADAFYGSFKTYKGRIFLLCSHEISVGALSNWADRLLAMMEVGDFIGAIRLATAYYVGESNNLTIGLPEDPNLRHPMVEERLLEMMSASLRYAFGRNPNASRKEVLGKNQLQELASACFAGCLSMNRTGFLFDEVFEYYEGEPATASVFLECLEPYILERRITFIPPLIVKTLITHYASLEQQSRLETMICHMDTRTLDIDQVTTLCKQYRLYDAMTYVWNRALGDYITPMVDLLSLLVPLIQNGIADKIFPYLSYTLTGRVYPTGEDIPEVEAANAKAQIYYFLFLGHNITWPKQGGSRFLTRPMDAMEPSFPYLRLILQFDASSFLRALNEAFEDSFLNDTADPLINQEVAEEQVFGRSVNRQYVVSILLEVMNRSDFSPQDIVYLNIFIARNLPKFPQFILLSGSSLHRILVELCDPPSNDIAEDCQLSVEYLLTVYRPPNIDELVELFADARFFRVLKSVFRSEKKYPQLLRAYFDDEEALEAVFDCISDCLRPRSGLNDKQVKDVKAVIKQNAQRLMLIDEVRTARIINSYAIELHGDMLATTEDSLETQFNYLRTILEPGIGQDRPEMSRPAIMDNPSFVETYIRLMCDLDPDYVSDYVGGLQSGDLRLENVLPALENSGVMDGAVVLMAREGQIRQAMDRLLSHLGTLETAFSAVVEASFALEDRVTSNDAANKTLESLQKYACVGVWLCQGQMKTGNKNPNAHILKMISLKNELSKEELLWLDLVDVVVRIAKNCITLIHKPPIANGIGAKPATVVAGNSNEGNHLDIPRLEVNLRKFVQNTFSALLAATSSSTAATSFLRILRAFLVRASLSSPSLADLRNVLGDIFETYIYEEQLLSLADRLLDRDLFVHLEDAIHLRQRGWKTVSQACEACGKRIWGPGAAGGIYSAWEKSRLQSLLRLERQRAERRLRSDGSMSAVARGKTRAFNNSDIIENEYGESVGVIGGGGLDGQDQTGEIVLFSCRHIYHRKCLENLQMDSVNTHSENGEYILKCVVCEPSGITY